MFIISITLKVSQSYPIMGDGFYKVKTLAEIRKIPLQKHKPEFQKK